MSLDKALRNFQFVVGAQVQIAVCYLCCKSKLSDLSISKTRDLQNHKVLFPSSFLIKASEQILKGEKGDDFLIRSLNIKIHIYV